MDLDTNFNPEKKNNTYNFIKIYNFIKTKNIFDPDSTLKVY